MALSIIPQGVPIIALMILELVGIVWVYGLTRLLKDIEFMLNRKTGLYWKVCWGIFNPIFLIVVFVYSQAKATPLQYGDYVYDDVATGKYFTLPYRVPQEGTQFDGLITKGPCDWIYSEMGIFKSSVWSNFCLLSI